jgi:hypothetical protein
MYKDCLQKNLKYMSKYLQDFQETFRKVEQCGVDSSNQGSYRRAR